MKFLVKINRNYLILFITILLVSSVAGYFILSRVIRNASEESLLEKKKLIVAQIEKTGEIVNLPPVLEVTELEHPAGISSGFKRIMIQNVSENEEEPFLEYEEEIRIGNTWYSIKLRQSAFEQEDLIIIITLSFILIVSVSFGITFFVSRKINRSIWRNFETNLKEIEHFNFKENIRIALVKSGIDEFDRLNQIIESLTDKLSADYRSLKEFTENAAHEIQTPLSVALLHLDEILQQDLNEMAFEKTAAAIQALKRLASLNQSLILLSKIENRQFIAEREIVLNVFIKRKLKEFESLFEAKHLQLEYSEESEFRLSIHEQLAEILFNNLLSNAIKHNQINGSIHLVVDRQQIKICNTGKPVNMNGDEIFDRFTKSDSKSFGLGLAIVKKICDTHDLKIEYRKNQMHCFLINQRNQRF